MMKRVSPAERLRAEIDQVFAGGRDLSQAVEEVARLGAQLLLQCALEAEVSAFLGRDRYARMVEAEDARQGMRNGYCPTTIKTTAGPITLQRPKLRNTTERFASQLFGKHVTKTNALETLVIAGFVRGLSTRDVEAALAEALGESATVSRSTVSRICAEIKTQYQDWSRRRLDDVQLDYLFLDGSHFRYHINASAEPVLAAWGIDTDGKPVFIGLDAAAAESGDAWEGFLTDLGERGLGCPLLVISDGAPGLIRAAERAMGAALRQRCLIHVARNVLAKVSKDAQAEVKANYWAIFDVPEDIAPGLDAVVGREPARKLRRQEGLPLIGLRGAVAHRWPVPVRVEAGHATHRHHHRQPGSVEPAERAGLDVPSVAVVPRPQPVQQIHRTGAATLELDLNVAAHRRRRHTQHFGRSSCRRCAAEDGDQGR